MAKFKANRSKRADNIRDFSSVRPLKYYFISVLIITDHATASTLPFERCAIPELLARFLYTQLLAVSRRENKGMSIVIINGTKHNAIHERQRDVNKD